VYTDSARFVSNNKASDPIRWNPGAKNEGYDLMEKKAALVKASHQAVDREIREKNDRKAEKARRRRGNPIICKSIKDLPPECVDILRKSLIDQKKIDQYFDIILNILRFRTGYQVVTKIPEKKPTILTMSFLNKPPETLFSSENPEKLYSQLNSIGKGGYGTVFLGHSSKEGGSVAIKVLPHTAEKQKKQI